MATEIHWIHSADEFAPWQEAWLDLLSRTDSPITPFHHPAWIRGCWAWPSSRLAIGLLAQGHQILAGLVFNAEIDAGPAVLIPIRLLSLTPHISSAHPACLVAVSHPAPNPDDIGLLLDKALDTLRWDALFLNFLNPTQAWLEDAIRSAAKSRSWRIREGASSTDAYIDASGGSLAYMARRGPNIRKNQRLARNRLLALGEFSIAEVARNDISNADIETRLVCVFERCWQHDSIHSPLHPSARTYFFTLLANMRAVGLLRVYLMTIGNTDIAFECGFVDPHAGGLYYACVRGYDEAYKKYSPGNLLTEFTIEDTASSGLSGIYLGPIHLSADTKYKQTWLTEERAVRNCLIIPPKSIYGLLDSLYQKLPFFRAIWWKLRIGDFVRRRYWKNHAPIG